MTKEEAYNYLREDASDTSNGLMVHISSVEKVIELVAVNDELKENALDMCVGDCLDWVQIGNAKYYVDVALGIEQ